MPQEYFWNYPNKIKAAIALLLTFAAGYVDVVGFLALYGIFAANMTGNTVHFADHSSLLTTCSSRTTACVAAGA